MENNYYHPLPGSDSKSNSSNEENEETLSHDVAESSSHKHNGIHINKYALAAAILASTNSILLGYGKFN